MSIKIYQSHSYEALTKKLSEFLFDGSKSVFSTEYIFYQSRGMRGKLPVDLACFKGIFGGAEFIPLFKLEDFLIEKTGLPVYKTSIPNIIKYNIFKCLDDDAFKSRFESIAAYYESDEIKRMQLAIQIENLFSKYIEHRREMMTEWLKEGFTTENHHEKWQAFLWKIIINSNSELNESFYKKVNFQTSIDQPELQKSITKNLPRVFFFGITSLSLNEISLIKKLSGITETYLFLLSPSENIAENNNEFIEYLAKKGKDTINALNETFKTPFTEYLKSNNGFSGTLLGKVQCDIVTGVKTALFDKNNIDRSIQINSAYTPVRELEALYHYLLDLSKLDNGLKPKDVLVLIPELEEYAPYIKSVFESNKNEYNFPYSIDRQIFSGQNTPAGILNNLLEISEDDFTSETIAQLLEHPVISSVFGINDLEKIREWLKEVNIRCGINGSGNPEDETYIVSFQYGLMRLIYSFALGENVQYQGHGKTFDAPAGEDIYPAGRFEGRSDLALLCRFKFFVDNLIYMLEKRRHERTLNEWAEYVNSDVIFAFLIKKDEERDYETEDFTDTVVHLQKKVSEFVSGMERDTEKISYKAFMIIFSGFISSQIRESRTPGGGITFASYNAMAGLEHKLVAILGMNYNNLPGSHSRLSFNLMNESRPGDPDLKEQDKYIFLLSLLSAQKYLYLSYIGRSAKDNSTRPPSILTEQLIDYLQIDEKELSHESKIWVQHPLHTFSYKYNNPAFPRLVSYDVAEKTKKREKSTVVADLPEIEDTHNIISIKKLIGFYKDPLKLYINQKLGYYTYEEEVLLDEQEPFEIDDGLAKHQIKSFLMEKPDEVEREKYLRKQKHTGLLPLAKAGEEELQKTEDEIEEIRQRYISLKQCSNKIEKSKSLPVCGKELKGEYTIYDNRQVFYCTSKWSSAAKYIIEAWIRHLFVKALGENVDTYLILFENKENKKKPDIVFSNNCISTKDAFIQTEKLVKCFLDSHTNPPAFDLSELLGFGYKAQHYELAVNLELITEQDIYDRQNYYSDIINIDIVKNCIKNL